MSISRRPDRPRPEPKREIYYRAVGTLAAARLPGLNITSLRVIGGRTGVPSSSRRHARAPGPAGFQRPPARGYRGTAAPGTTALGPAGANVGRRRSARACGSASAAAAASSDGAAQNAGGGNGWSRRAVRRSHDRLRIGGMHGERSTELTDYEAGEHRSGLWGVRVLDPLTLGRVFSPPRLCRLPGPPVRRAGSPGPCWIQQQRRRCPAHGHPETRSEGKGGRSPMAGRTASGAQSSPPPHGVPCRTRPCPRSSPRPGGSRSRPPRRSGTWAHSRGAR